MDSPRPEPLFRVKRYQKNLGTSASTAPGAEIPLLSASAKASRQVPPHNRELAPFRLDGHIGPSAIRPCIPKCAPTPLSRPCFHQPSRYDHELHIADAPLVKPIFQTNRRSQPYPTDRRLQEVVVANRFLCSEERCQVDRPNARTVCNDTFDAPMRAAFSGAPRPNRGFQPLQSAKEKEKRNHALSLWTEVCSALAHLSKILASLQESAFGDDCVQMLIRQYSENTVLRYSAAVLNFLQWVKDLDIDLDSLSVGEVVDILRLMHSDVLEDDAAKTPLVSLNTLKALRWCSSTLDLKFPDMWSPIFNSLSSNSTAKHESFPFPLFVAHEFEKALIAGKDTLQDTIFRGSILLCIWASLRFNDAQHVLWNSLILDLDSLRGVVFQAKTSKQGYPFGIKSWGIIGPQLENGWVVAWLHALDEVWNSSMKIYGLSFVPDHLFPVINDSGVILEPMSYSQAISHLRRLLSQLPPMRSQAHVYTLHSAKATMLSWACQLSLDPSSRALQGHHKSTLQSSVELYGRDSIHAPLQLQERVRDAIVNHNFRPSQPQHRGAQPSVKEPAVDLLRSFTTQSLLFECFKFDLRSPPDTLVPPRDVRPPEECTIDQTSPVSVPEASASVSFPFRNSIPDPDMSQPMLFIINNKTAHVAAWTIRTGDGRTYRPKCGAMPTAEASISFELPSSAKLCKRSACIQAFNDTEQEWTLWKTSSAFFFLSFQLWLCGAFSVINCMSFSFFIFSSFSDFSKHAKKAYSQLLLWWARILLLRI